MNEEKAFDILKDFATNHKEAMDIIRVTREEYNRKIDCEYYLKWTGFIDDITFCANGDKGCSYYDKCARNPKNSIEEDWFAPFYKEEGSDD